MAQVLRAVKGATLTEPLALTNRDGTPTDLSGATITWMAKSRIDDADVAALITATTGNGRIVVDDAPGGLLHLDVPASVTDSLDPGQVYAWTLQIFVGGAVVRYPDDFQGGPGRLLVAASAIMAVPS